MPDHHPSQELLSHFTSGQLDVNHAVAVAGHIGFCAECRAEASTFETLAAESFAMLDPEPVPAGAFDAVMARLDEAAPPAPPPPPVPGLPTALARLIPGGLDQVPWQRLARGIGTADLMGDPGDSKVSLLNIDAGRAVGVHRHTADEVTLILAGSYDDETGHYGVGDFVIMQPWHHHNPVATRDGNCICLAVLGGPIQFTRLPSRLSNPLLRHYYRRPV